jgi:Carboxypeptidase regulatory-like domain
MVGRVMSGIRSLLSVTVLSVVLCPGVFTRAQIVTNSVVDGTARSSPTGQASDKKYVLSGSVVNSVTGEGIPHALVSINQIAMLSDAGGNFRFDELRAGTYFVQAQKPGFFDPQTMSHRHAPAQVEVGPDSHSVTVKLIPEAVIFGRVVDSDGMPVVRLPVQSERLTYVEGRKQWQTAGSKVTDEDGYYRISNLTPGTYVLMAGPSMRPSLAAIVKTARMQAGYARTYYSAPAEGSSEAGMPITAGQKFEADFNVEAQPFYSVSGSTIGPPSGIAPGWVRLEPRGEHRSQRGLGAGRDSSGTFHISMAPAGDYILEAEAQGPMDPGSSGSPQLWKARVPLHLGSDVSGLQIALEPLVAIQINTQEELSSSSPNQPVIVAGGRGNFAPVKLRSVDDPERVVMGSYQQINGKPVHQFDHVESGTYALEIDQMGGDKYIASAHYGSTDLLKENLVVGQSANQDPIEIVMRDDVGRVKATLKGSGLSGSQLLVVPDHGIPYAPRTSVTTDGTTSATYDISGLAPGSYTILAFDSLDFEYTNRDALDPYLEKGAHVEVTANQESTVSLELIRREEE